MICEQCNKNQAKIMVSMIVQGKKINRYLCQSCLNKIKEDFQLGDIEGFLSSLISHLPQTPKEKELTCSVCGLNYSEFQRSGKLGCANCYKDFKPQLEPMLRRIHGRNHHAGRIPARFEKTLLSAEEETLTMEEQINRLKKDMQKAILKENFERAAQLRDEIKALTASKGDDTDG